MANQEPAFAWPFGNGPVRVGTRGLFRLCLRTFVAPFPPARLTAPGSPRMDRSWFKEANDSNCPGICCIVIGCFSLFSGYFHFRFESRKKKKKSDNRFSFFISSMFRKKWQSNKDFNFLISKKQIFIFLFSNFSMVGEKWKLKINCQYYFSFFLIKKMKIEHWFSFFIFQLSEKNEWP